MLLTEFFNKPLDVYKDKKQGKHDDSNLEDELFWYILDHDKLHKDYFFPIAKKMKNIKEIPALLNPRFGHAAFIAKTGAASTSLKYFVGFGKNKLNGAN